MKKLFFAILGLVAAGCILSSCLGSDVEDYQDWREQNDRWLDTVDKSGYNKVTATWAPYHEIYMKWYNDRRLTADSLSPLSTSTISVKYELEDIEGNMISTSYKTNGDSLFTAVVNRNIIGFQMAVMNMNVGDSVSVIIPYTAGYGKNAKGSVRPYTNLVYRIKLVKIPALEKPYN